MKDFFDFLKNFSIDATERVKFPLFNSFVFSWLVFNWKPILIILFSEQSIEGRISSVVNGYSHPLNLIIFPAIISAAYVLGLPYLKRELHECLDPINRKNRDNAYDYRISSFDKKILLVEKETEVEIRKSGNLDLNLLNQKVATKNAEIEKLKTENIGLLQEVETYNKRLKDSPDEHRKLEDTISNVQFNYQNDISQLEDLADRQQATLANFLDATRNFVKGLPTVQVDRMNEFLHQHSKNAEYLRKDYEKLRFKLLTKNNNTENPI